MARFSGNAAHDAQGEDKTSIRVAMNRSSWQLYQNYWIKKVLHVHMWTSLYAISFFHQIIMMCCQTHAFWGWQNLGT